MWHAEEEPTLYNLFSITYLAAHLVSVTRHLAAEERGLWEEMRVWLERQHGAESLHVTAWKLINNPTVSFDATGRECLSNLLVSLLDGLRPLMEPVGAPRPAAPPVSPTLSRQPAPLPPTGVAARYRP